MTPDASRPADGGHSHGSPSDLDILAGLWEEARFARLPWDAPSELRDLVEDIDNPKRVYAIHKASRRHNFQLLVQRFTVQLREGCGSEYCSTPTCFTCRKRLAGRAPIRRYNTTSSRTLATYLASQDNPESGLCPGLRSPKALPAALNSLVLLPNQKSPLRDDSSSSPSPKGRAPAGRGALAKGNVSGLQSNPVRTRNGSLNGSDGGALRGKPRSGSSSGEEHRDHAQKPGFSVTESAVSTDYRSFAANVFGTVAFKMLEWLTPAAIEQMSRKAQVFQTEADSGGRSLTTKDLRATQDDGSLSPRQKSGHASSGHLVETNGNPNEASAPVDPKEDRQQREALPVSRSGSQRRNSNAKVRTSSTTKQPKRQLSIDPFAPEALADEPFSGLLKSPRANGGVTDRNVRGIKTTSSTLSRPISQLSSAGFFDDVTLEKMPPLKPVDFKPKVGRAQLDGARSSESASPKDMAAASGVTSERSCSHSSNQSGNVDSDSDDDNVYPQTISKLNADIVDFICDVIQEDGTAEKHMLEPPSITKFHNKYSNRGKPLRRRSKAGPTSSAKLKLEWKLFMEQTFFYVLSDPQLALRSFSMKGQLYDSQTLWYCMLRMTRVAPSLVFHSLWMAAGSLFAPPKSLQSLRSPTAKLFPQHEDALSNSEAGRLMSICLHALVAAAPLVTDSRQLQDISRIRSHGLSLAGSGSVAQQPAELCLQYEDAFTDELALRLARRLFTAITTRCYYDDITESNFQTVSEYNTEEQDIMVPLFSQLDFLNMDAVYILNFSFSDRTLHEARVPILLLDWARAVMLNDWNGSPEVSGDGPIGGALALIKAMYEKRQDLLLGDAQFRSEYFADRLDTMQMPVAWMSHVSTRRKLHLLDFPYIFNPATLVSYFRAINFSRMSRAFEEATSLQERIDAIAVRSNLSTHHRDVLAEQLKAAASKYLILDIKRESVLQDVFNQLWRREERELQRPLKVHLGEQMGEEGFDSGGVQQEFFRIAIAEALNPDYGAFTVDERTRMTWFVPGSMEPEWKFELIGMLVSLAVYNGLTLPVTLPKALYRKLLGEPVTELHHIADGWPDLANGLTQLLEWDEKDGLVEDVFARTYEFSVSVFGEHITREMKPQATNFSERDEWPQFPQMAWQSASQPPLQEGNPAEAPLVTNANRNAYVSDYIRYLTGVSVEPQFEAFQRGFRACLHVRSLKLLTPAILQSIVEGVQEIDIGELRRHTRYVGWDAGHRTIKDFWSIVKRYDDEMKRKLLEFVTASDRVPVGGVKNMMFIIQKNGCEDGRNGRLPTSYTCYGTLLLPEYRDKEMLRDRLAMALENAQGFGFA
ncbi:hypothetical protein B0T25DRAFT_481866 [Lasiosphaeria hispida]|uniref:HECT-type E3 ubiquitin transferase n=1 Tax=Lasiosphaeria hispida TaxID=260671 RepID=A0AAJ0HEE1_9PEZI|nr:hypothetical protein B0T25DRAFT_481866 [Lasiosphaeria hispida]